MSDYTKYNNITCCRNCLSKEIIISDKGYPAQFFLKKVLDIEYDFSLEKLLDRRIDLTEGIIGKTIGRMARKMLTMFKPTKNEIEDSFYLKTQISICKNCNFVGPKFNYNEDMLNKLYYNYRSEHYNKERSYYEPGYAKIMNLVGKNDLEVKFRKDNLNEIVESNIEIADVYEVLDFGGGNGTYIPDGFKKKSVTILDISNEELIDKSFKIIERLDDNDIFDYVQICHVLEHVTDPHMLVSNVLKHLKIGGYLYIEVPQDRSKEYIDGILNNSAFYPHFIHEHINLYSETAIAALGKALNMEIIYLRKRTGQLGWTDLEIISALFKKI